MVADEADQTYNGGKAPVSQWPSGCYCRRLRFHEAPFRSDSRNLEAQETAIDAGVPAQRAPKAKGLSAGKWTAHKIWPPNSGEVRRPDQCSVLAGGGNPAL